MPIYYINKTYLCFNSVIRLSNPLDICVSQITDTMIMIKKNMCARLEMCKHLCVLVVRWQG